MHTTLETLDHYASDIYLQFMTGLTEVERQFVLASVERLNQLENSKVHYIYKESN